MRCRLSPSPSPSPSPAPFLSPPGILLPPLLTATAILSAIALTLLIINYLLRTLRRPASVDEPPAPPPPPATVLLPAVSDARKKSVTVGSIPVLDFAKEEKLRRLSHVECSICHSALEAGQRCVFCSASAGFAFASVVFSIVDWCLRHLRRLWLPRRRAGTI